MLFQVTQCYTKEDVAAYYYAATKSSNRRTRALRHALQFSFLISAVALVALAGWLMWWVFQQTLFLLSALAVLPALIALPYSSYVLLHSILASTEKGSIKNMWAGYSQKGGQMTITFEDAQFIMALPWYETHYQYAAIKVIMESDGHYFLSLVNNTYIILRKSCLIEGDPAVLGLFIRQKRLRYTRQLSPQAKGTKRLLRKSRKRTGAALLKRQTRDNLAAIPRFVLRDKKHKSEPLANRR